MDGSPISILEVEPGQTVRLSKITAGRGLRHRLAAMGVLPDSQITVLRVVAGGQVIVKVKDSRIVLGRGMANKIFVV